MYAGAPFPRFVSAQKGSSSCHCFIVLNAVIAGASLAWFLTMLFNGTSRNFQPPMDYNYKGMRHGSAVSSGVKLSPSRQSAGNGTAENATAAGRNYYSSERKISHSDLLHPPEPMQAVSEHQHIDGRNNVTTRRVCVCFYGLVKQYDMVAQSVKKHIFDVIKAANYTYDVYAHTYNITSVFNERNKEMGLSIDPTSLKRVLPRARVIYDTPEAADGSVSLDDLLVNGDPWPENPRTSLRYYVRQLYSLRRLTELWAPKMNDYDYCIYLRPDVFFISDLDLFDKQQNLTRSALATPGWQQWTGRNDRFAYGVPSVMQIFGNRLNGLQDYVTSQRKQPHAEIFLGAYVKAMNLTSILSQTKFKRMRANGKLDARDTDFTLP